MNSKVKCPYCGNLCSDEDKFFFRPLFDDYQCPKCEGKFSFQWRICAFCNRAVPNSHIHFHDLPKEKEKKLTLVSFIIHGVSKSAFVFLRDEKISGEVVNELIKELYGIDNIPRGTTITIG